MARNSPKNIDDLFRNNDVELFDLSKDPGEMNNLAVVKGENPDLVLSMSAKLEKVIKDEIGIDDGREMPEMKGLSWRLNSKGSDTILD